MPDMLVKLYNLPPLEPLLAAQTAAGVSVRRALPPERHLVLNWVTEFFGPSWASECAVAFGRQPLSCWIAVQDQDLLGFACYEVTWRGVFGPTGVRPDLQGRGIGKVLLLAALHSLAHEGYAYGIIGGVGPAEFYASAAGAVVIPDSDPGLYRGLLKG